MIIARTIRPRNALRTALLLTTALVAAAVPGAAMAQDLPTGGQVVAGSATIAAGGADMTITTGTQRTVIDWNSFSIGTDSRLTIRQPDANAINVNRVVGTDPSKIFGALSSNGRVVIANPNGVWFGPSARVDVAGIVASAGRISNDSVSAFSAGGSLRIDAGNAGSSVINEGIITAREGGFAALVAPGVRNSGSITARLGQVALAAGRTTTVDFYGDGLINLAIAGATYDAPLDAAVTNSGAIYAEGGQILLSANVAEGLLNNVINMSGTIEARGVSTTGGVVELLGGSGSIEVAGNIDVRGTGAQNGGKITVRAGDATSRDGVVNFTGTLDASATDGNGGTIETESRFTFLGGSVKADGATGGAAVVKAVGITQSGRVSANATSGAGGSVTLDAERNITQTASAITSANSEEANGGTIIARTGATGRTFSSGMLTATGAAGGAIQILGNDIALAAAKADASGATGQGGAVLVGGDLHGIGPQTAATTLVNASTTLVANGGTHGNGGRVVVWSDEKTNYQGNAVARGGSSLGNGGIIEVSSSNLLQFGGGGDAGATMGKAGTLLLDPKNIVIEETTGGLAVFDLIDPNAGLGSGFGTMTASLSNGTVVVTKPGDEVGGAADAGSVYFYDSETGGLISTFQGSHAGDKVAGASGDSLFGGYGLMFLDQLGGYDPVTFASRYDGSKAFLIVSPTWNAGRGAITWVDANSTVSGILSASNSLVGNIAGDTIGAMTNNSQPSIDILASGNYVVRSPNWNDNRGAITFASGSTGITGIVGASNSMVGSTSTTANGNGRRGDSLGSGGLVKLANGNFVVLSPYWNKNGGAVTFGDGLSGFAALGAVDSVNSLVGNAGVTYSATDTVNNPNRTIYGFYGGDNVGADTNRIAALSNGDFLVLSGDWGHGRGAVTMGNGISGIGGTVSASNSLIGTTKGTGDTSDGTDTYFTNTYGVRKWYGGDNVGGSGVTELANGGFAIKSANWSSNRGAVTYFTPGTTSLSGTVATGNSLTGTTAGTASSYNGYHERSVGGGDQVGSNVVALANGNYVAATRNWNGGLGAVTVLDGTNGYLVTGGNGTAGDTISASNSLVGSTSSDNVGNMIVPLTGTSDFVTSAYEWGGGKGAVTKVSGTAGIAGAVSSANSLVGVTGYERSNLGGDNVGSTVRALSSGGWAILSPNWNKTRGAATFVAAGGSITGTISASNSFVGTTGAVTDAVYCNTCVNGNPAMFGGDLLGSGGLVELTNGNVLLLSPEWNQRRGAVTYINGATGGLLDGTASLTGTLSNANSFVGSNAATVYTSSYNTGSYSLVGMHYYLGGDQVGASDGFETVRLLSNGNVLLSSSRWKSLAGAVTFMRGDGHFADGSAFVGTLSAANSVVGVDSASLNTPPSLSQGNYGFQDDGDRIGYAGFHELADGSALLFSPYWNGKTGAITRLSGTQDMTGTLDATNSFVGAVNGDRLGDYGATGVVMESGGGFFLNNVSAAGGQSAITYNDGTSPLTGTLSLLNSFLGDPNAPTGYGFGVKAAASGTILMDFAAEGTGSVLMGFTDPTNWTYARAQGQTMTISPTLITKALNSGTSLVLQANNDITINDAIIAATTATGNLTLEAGRSILVHADINLGNGSLGLLANNSVANGVINAYRDAGNAEISFDAGTRITTGGGNVGITLNASTDKTYNGAGDILLGEISANAVWVLNSGSGNLTLGGAISAAQPGTSITLGTGGAFVNQAGGAALTPGSGRYLIYSADPRNNTLGGLTADGKYYRRELGLYPTDLPATDNLLLYSVAPTLTVTGNASVGYGDAASSVTPQITGFIDGDTAQTALTGAASTSTAYQAGDAVGGSYALNVSQDSLNSPLGYVLNFVSGTVTVTPKQLGLALTGSVTKEYDRSTTATLGASNYQLTGLYGTDSITIGTTGGLFDSANASSNIGVSVNLSSGSFTAGGSTMLSNYVLPTGLASANIGTITPRQITLTGVAAQSRSYDGTAIAALSGGALSGVLGGDTVGFTAGSGLFGDKNVGANKAISISGYALTGAGAGNYSLSGQPAGISASITARTLTLAGVAAQDRDYDGTTAITLTGGSLSGILGNDAVALDSGTGSVADANIGTKSVTAAHFGLIGTDAANYALGAQPTGLTATINAKALNLSGVTAADRTYDGTQAVALSGGTLSGIIGSDVVTLATGSGSFADKSVGTNKAISISGYALTGAGAGNYVLGGQPTGLTATISAKALDVLGVTASDRIYDGTTFAVLSGGSISGLIGNDVVTLVTGNGAFLDKNAGVNKLVTLAGYGLTGTDAGNYSLGQPANLTATISAKAVTLSGVTAINRTYDGTTQVALSGGSLSGIIGNDAISLVTGTGSIADKNVGAARAVTVSGFDLSGLDAGNYALSGQPTGLTASISAKAITLSGVTALDRNYDGTTLVALAGGSVSGLVGSDTVEVVTGTANLVDANAGVNKALTISGFGIQGLDAGNYLLSAQPAGLTATITPKALTLSGVTAINRTYDGTTQVALSGGSLSGIIGGDAITLITGSGSMVDKNVGAAKVVTASGFGLGGVAANNYTLSGQPTGLTTSIGAKALTLSGVTAFDSIYNGTTQAVLGGGTLAGIVGGDAIALVNGTGAFADKNVGANKIITATDFGISGSDASNYALSGQPTGLTASVTPKSVSLSDVTALGRAYDGTTAVALAGGTVSGILSTDAIDLIAGTGIIADKNVGTSKAVTVSGFGLGGADAGNYTLSGQPAGLSVTIAQRSVTLSGIAASDRDYDGSRDVALTDGTLSGLIATDAVSLLRGTASVADKKVGVNKAVSLSGFGLTGADATNYVFGGTPTGLTVTIAPKAVTLSGMKAVDRAYDGTTTVALLGGSLSGLVTTDAVTLVRGQGTLADKNVGPARSVTVEGFGLDGADAGNYTLAGQPNGLSVAITPAQLSIDLNPGSVTKTYDGTATATLGASSYTIAGLVSGESIGIANTSGSFASARAGANVGVSFNLSLTDYIAGAGTSLSNYDLPTGTFSGSVGAILPAALLVRADDRSKVAGEALPTLSVSYSGFKGTDNAASTGLLPVVDTMASALSPAGIYAIQVSGGQLADYAVTYAPGILTVTPQPIPVPVQALIVSQPAQQASLINANPTGNVLINVGASTAFLPTAPALPATMPQGSTMAIGSSNAGLGAADSGAQSANSYANSYLNSIKLESQQ